VQQRPQRRAQEAATQTTDGLQQTCVEQILHLSVLAMKTTACEPPAPTTSPPTPPLVPLLLLLHLVLRWPQQIDSTIVVEVSMVSHRLEEQTASPCQTQRAGAATGTPYPRLTSTRRSTAAREAVL